MIIAVEEVKFDVIDDDDDVEMRQLCMGILYFLQ